MYYIVSFDILDSNSNDYDAIYEKAEKHFLKFCKILSTTCLIKSNKTVSEIQEWFERNTNGINIRLFISEYTPKRRWYYLSKSVVKCVKELEK